MRIQYMSDLHCEFFRDEGVELVSDLPVEGDVLVIAGDLCLQRQAVKVLSILAERFPHVVYVAGNHEYYRSDRGAVGNNRTKMNLRYPNLHWLANTSVDIDGIRFHGTTMWFRDHPMNWQYQQDMNDFYQIQGFRKWVYHANASALAFLEREVRQGDVVVTHHAPTSISVPERFRGSQMNRFYVCDCSDVLYRNRPALWFHGHMHDSSDYRVIDTRVLCNPHGYVPDGLNPDFNRHAFVELEVSSGKETS